jgi:excisionase family DNA binding protein
MAVFSAPTTSPDKYPFLERLAGQVEAMNSMLGDLVSTRIPALEAKLQDVSESIAGRRKEHYTIDEVAQLTGRAPYTVRRWVSEGKLRASRLRDGGPRGRLLVARAELDRLVADGKGAEVPEITLA